MIVTSCTKNIGTIGSTRKIIYQKGTKNAPDPNIFGDHLKKVVLVSINDSVVQNFINSTAWRRIENNLGDSLKTDSIKLVVFDNTGIVAFHFKIVNSSKVFDALNVYEYRGNFIITRAVLTSISPDSKYVVYSGDMSEEYYEFCLNSNNQVGHIHLYNDVPFFKVFTPDPNPDPDFYEIPCPQQYPNNFGKCMLCAINDCSQDWICAVVCALEPELCMAGFALACFGGTASNQ